MTKEEVARYFKELIRCADWVEDSYIDGVKVEAIRSAIEELEERKTGKWIEKDGWDGDVYYDCSACGESWTTIEGTPWDNDMNYCPHCGAKMEGADDGTN